MSAAMGTFGMSVVSWTIAGCNSVNMTAPRATDPLRTTCYWLDDEEIDALLTDIADARDFGDTKAELLAEAAAECAAASTDVSGCNSCFDMAIETVYN